MAELTTTSPDEQSNPRSHLAEMERDQAEDRDYRDRHDNRDADASIRDRDRSRSPARPPKKKDYSKGFSWKKKSPTDADDDQKGGRRDIAGDEYRPKRYGGKDDRDRFVERNRERDRNRDRDRDRARDREHRADRDRGFDREYRSRDDRKEYERSGDYDRPDRDHGRKRDREGRRHHDRDQRGDDKAKTDKKLPAQTGQSAQPEFIVVTVNDRLGTKARVPCLPTDTIGDFKKLVAAQIGRAPHEIMLKRQSQRPFKDSITLADYEIQNGVQLDLELDTGD